MYLEFSLYLGFGIKQCTNVAVNGITSQYSSTLVGLVLFFF
ncbi:hypothetical protein BAE44_0022907 [Dichanthelium oligosanthes]|uniref:Uncharacterized protein n=1 Tax=Dichanthelium oligosanthes TaxID=888268 RepID=A0A1E5UT64_9POAL|nr:hypothetical protein BAE44_0022907 [Dichanthelium oligosanthes]